MPTNNNDKQNQKPGHSDNKSQVGTGNKPSDKGAPKPKKK
jgi:hypothetical protein